MSESNGPVKAIDTHAHFSTETGFHYSDPEEKEKIEAAFNREIPLKTEAEMADDFRAAGVKSILHFTFTLNESIEETRALHDYAEELISANSDVFFGFWAALDPRLGLDAFREFERCVFDLDLGLVGLAIDGTINGTPPSDPAYDMFYEFCIEQNLPVHINVGYTASGAGMPGGNGLKLEHCHPKHVDRVAAEFPELKIIVGRPAWPGWQKEMIASMLHKPNIVGYELHGWSPKYISDDLKWEVDHRLEDRIMFGSDYPYFEFDRMFTDWENMDYDDDVIRKVFHDNAARVFESAFGVEL